MMNNEEEKEKKLSNIPEPFEKNRRMEWELESAKKNQIKKVFPSGYNSIRIDEPVPEKIKNTEIGKFKEVISHPEEAKDLLAREADHYNENLIEQDKTDGLSETPLFQERDISLTADEKEEQNKTSTTVEVLFCSSFFSSTKLPESDNNLSSNKPSCSPESYTGKGEQLGLFDDKLLSEEAKKNHKIIGQLFSTYWIVEYKDKMFIIDQHAAHEKVLYEKTMKAMKEKEYQSQMINPPIILTLSMREEDTLLKHMESLNQLGFEIEAFGGKEYSVRAVPNDLYGIAQKDLLIELIDNLVEDIHTKNPDIILEKIASMSCKAAVKGNNKLSFLEIKALIDQLLTLENPYHCPHGRPTIISMSKYEIEKKFKRII